MLEASMGVAGINAAHCDPFHDRGDGVLALVHPVDDVPKTLLLNPLVPVLWRLLLIATRACRSGSTGGGNSGSGSWRTPGEIHCDGKGYFGEALDVAFRVLGRSRLKDSLNRGPGPLVLAVSDIIYWSIVSQDYEGIPRESCPSPCCGSRWPGAAGPAGCTCPRRRLLCGAGPCPGPFQRGQPRGPGSPRPARRGPRAPRNEPVPGLWARPL